MNVRKKSNREVKINTTALPDIIFMLLFFFMVTTVMQTQTISELELPSMYGITPKADSKQSELTISLYSNNGETTIKVDGQSTPIDQVVALVTSASETKRSQGIYVDRAVLYIDTDIVMSTVNQVKETLQDLQIYQVNYIHDYVSND